MEEKEHIPEERLFEYVRDELPAEQRIEIEQHAGICPECSARLAFVRRMMQALVLEDEPAPAKLVPSVMEKIRAERKRRFRRIALSLAASAAACALFVSVWMLLPGGLQAENASPDRLDYANSAEPEKAQNGVGEMSIEEFGDSRFNVQNAKPRTENVELPPDASDSTYAIYTELCPEADEKDEFEQVLENLDANRIDDETYELPLELLEKLQHKANAYSIDFSNSILNRSGEKVLVKIHTDGE